MPSIVFQVILNLPNSLYKGSAICLGIRKLIKTKEIIPVKIPDKGQKLNLEIIEVLLNIKLRRYSK